MKQRLITAFVLIIVLAIVIWQVNTPLLAVVVTLLSAIAANEIMKCAKVENKFICVVGTGFAALVPLFSSSKVFEPILSAEIWGKVITVVPNVAYVIAIVLVFLLAMLKGYAYTTFEDVAVSVFASVLVPYGFSIFIRLRDLFVIRQFGIYLIFYALICALATDSGAQLAGLAFGKHKMSPNISPKKTIEGAVGGIVFSLMLNALAMILYNRFADVPMSVFTITVLFTACLPISLLSMMGDLSASVLKRNFGVKDFGKLFPGHGGVMDRFDSSLFTLPLTYVIAITILS